MQVLESLEASLYKAIVTLIGLSKITRQN